MTLISAKELISFLHQQQLHLFSFCEKITKCCVHTDANVRTATDMIRNEGICKSSRAEILREACAECC